MKVKANDHKLACSNGRLNLLTNILASCKAVDPRGRERPGGESMPASLEGKVASLYEMGALSLRSDRNSDSTNRLPHDCVTERRK